MTVPSLVIFDLDGVLLEAKKTHYNALNSAIDIVTKNPKYKITWSDHLNRYDGLNTTKKLQKLSKLQVQIW